MSEGRLLAAARIDAKRILSTGGIQVDITLTTPDNATSITVQGFGTGQFEQYDMVANPVNATKTHITVSEADLVAQSYPVRSATMPNKVALNRHKVSFLDNNGNTKNYVVTECRPNMLLGIITLQLGDSE